MDKSQELREVLLRYLDADLERIIFSNPRTRESYLKLTVRPLLLRGALAFQTEEFTENRHFRKIRTQKRPSSTCSENWKTVTAMRRSRRFTGLSIF